MALCNKKPHNMLFAKAYSSYTNGLLLKFVEAKLEFPAASSRVDKRKAEVLFSCPQTAQ